MIATITRTVVARRVAVRAGAQVWRHRLQWLAAGAAIAGMGAATQIASVSPAAAGGSDCADQVMQQLATPSVVTAHAAYRCLGDTYHNVLTEDAFVQQAQATDPPAPGRVIRTGETRTITGERVVLFNLERDGHQVPYALYLGPDNRVDRID